MSPKSYVFPVHQLFFYCPLIALYLLHLNERAVTVQELLNKTKENAATIAQNSPMAIAKAISAVNLSDTDKGFDTEIEYFGEVFELEDKKEGVTAFLEKRKPNF